MSPLARVAPLAGYLVLVGAAPFAALALADAGLRLDVSVLAVVTAVGTLIGVLEARFPFDPRWNRPRGDTRVDLLHLAVSTVAMTLLFELASARLPTFGVWPGGLPFVVQCALALLVAELGGYLAHRAMHEWPGLGRVHVVHHSALRLHALNSSRNHPLDALALLLAAGLPLVLLGTPARVIAALGAFAIAHLQFQHANTTLRLGPLNWVLAGPELHRWHHSTVRDEAHGNYGHVLMVWDVLFRSRVKPAGEAPAAVGLYQGDTLPETYAAHLGSPFR
ncbi:MAG: sterol desaturase family protein [Archangiaceae bacterium]|nr:sterol desaturase family protein [Archangiaceae bacterium]